MSDIFDHPGFESSQARLAYLVDKITGLRRELSTTFQLAETMVLDLHKEAEESIEARQATEPARLAVAKWRDQVLVAWQALVEVERNTHGR